MDIVMETGTIGYHLVFAVLLLLACKSEVFQLP